MKKISTITFHAAYNYGSNLQAYALQEYVKKICNNDCIYEIINLRNEKQKELNAIFKRRIKIKPIVRDIITLFHKRKIKVKSNRFEDFITNCLNITKEYNNLEELKKANFKYDYYISGSDQLWNLNAYDFDWANYLEFVNDGKKISYGASFGPKQLVWTEEDKKRIANDLKKYDNISVREQASFENVKALTGREADINIDPTMLLTKEEWNNLIPKEKIVTEDYILFYTLNPDKNMIKLVKEVSKILKLPVVITKFNNQYDAFSSFKKLYDTGPIEFLNLVKNAKLIMSSSFHGTIFSILFHKPFFAIRGNKDFRIQTLLKKMKLENRSIDENDVEEKCLNAYKIDFKEAEILLEEERKKSNKYLKEALDIE